MSTLGNRIKFFRKRAKISQFKLEEQIGASAGSLSRIESGEVNPTKETLEKIIKSLGLNIREENYLVGKTAEPTSDEIIKSLGGYLENYEKTNSSFFYLGDERWRILYVTSNILKIFGFASKEDYYKRAYKKTIIQFLVDPNLGLVKIISPDQYEQVLATRFYSYYQEVGFMIDDESFIDTLKTIGKFPRAKEIWEKVTSENYSKTHNEPDRFFRKAAPILFSIGGIMMTLSSSNKPLFDYANLEISEYYIANPVLRKLYLLFNL